MRWMIISVMAENARFLAEKKVHFWKKWGKYRQGKITLLCLFL